MDDAAIRCEIRVRGVLDDSWSCWFDGLHVVGDDGDETVISGRLADQTALHGVLAKIRDLGLPLLSVRVEDRHRRDDRGGGFGLLKPR